MLAVILSAVGFVLAVGGMVHYMAQIPPGRVPAVPTGHMVAEAGGAAVAVAAVWLGWGASTGVFAAIAGMSGLSLLMAGFFFFLMSQRKTPVGEIRVAVGDPLPVFAAQDWKGHAFDSASLRGQRVLLKFFRGHW
jgi:hypothetical protein